MTSQIRHRAEQFLYKRNFASAPIRHLLYLQMLVTGVSLVVAAITVWFTLWPAAFAAGALIATFNFWHIARFAQTYIFATYSSKISLKYFFGFSLRFAATGIALFLLIAVIKIPFVPLFAGLTSSLVAIVIWGISRSPKNTAKEA